MKNKLLKAVYAMTKYTLYSIIIQCSLTTLLLAAEPANSQMLEKVNITLEAENASLEDLLSIIETKTDFRFFYLRKDLPLRKKTSLSIQEENLKSLLQIIANNYQVKFKRINNQIVVTRDRSDKNIEEAAVIEIQKRTITGKVTDQITGDPMPAVTVLIAGTTSGTVTDIDGKYRLDIPADAEKLLFSFIGYATQEIEITNQSTINISMVQQASELDEIVVIGYGGQTKADVTGAVTQITEKNFRQGINTSADNLIQGKIAGVRVVGTSGEPGAGMNVTIRGVGSIRSGSTPLFVVDGVPLTNDDVSPGGSDVGFGSSQAKNPLNFLNTNDIESINVLKDASATAIYGARGSNGVIIITTKKGTKGEGTLSLDSYMGVSNLSKKLDVLSSDEYRNAITTSDYDHGGNTDWQDEIYRTALTYNHALSFSKQTNSGNYYVSLGRMDQEGIVTNSKLARTSGRINISESFLDDERLKVDLHLTASEIVDEGVPTSDDGGSNGQLIIHTLMANPTRSVFDEDGEYTNFNMNAHYNPAYLLSIYDDETRTLRVLGNVETSFRILKGLEYKLNVGIDRSMAERNTTVYPNLTDLNPTGRYVQNNLESKNSLLEHYLTYKLNLVKHNFTLLGGFSYQKFERSATSFGLTEIADQEDGIPPMYNPGYTGNQTGVSGFAQENELQSYFGRLNYSFSDKYLFTASMRADGSTRFGENNKYGYFPSFAAGWNMSDEGFLTGTPWVKNLKMRASWGKTGNQEVQNKITQASYSLSGADGYYLYDDLALVNGLSIARTPNPDLKWEVSTQYNIGADFNLFEGKLFGTVDYFNKTTTDAILNIPSEPLAPTDDIWVNIDGEIVNKGFEFMLGSELIQKEKFSWTVDFNGTFLDNEIKNLPVSEIYSGSISGPGQSGVLANIYKSGYSAGSFYLLEHDGFDEDGFDKFKDNNNDGVISGDDRVIIESALPTFMYGLNSNMTYGPIDFSFSIIGQSGAYLLNNTGLNALNINNLESDRNVSTKYYESGANPANSPQLSTYYLESSDFLRLNTARVGYRFNASKVNWLSDALIYVTGQNLFTITDYSGYDPLINSPKASGGNQSLGIDYPRYPSARTFILGVSVKI
ncbi:SusC/RagA family TonB-linked outer membrane protein [Flammeovirgaceae bacterium SG7u.111]|nr:SusC/RagA family TonB-linked outer membrane protein [Flammeovirgaceae bacterium SG7u.132]WPO37258.1 SusC/RagA family TonB-linked outer membrane protein [Flammeovirgaceae bacterium SG7u.111]